MTLTFNPNDYLLERVLVNWIQKPYDIKNLERDAKNYSIDPLPINYWHILPYDYFQTSKEDLYSLDTCDIEISSKDHIEDHLSIDSNPIVMACKFLLERSYTIELDDCGLVYSMLYLLRKYKFTTSIPIEFCIFGYCSESKLAITKFLLDMINIDFSNYWIILRDAYFPLIISNATHDMIDEIMNIITKELAKNFLSTNAMGDPSEIAWIYISLNKIKLLHALWKQKHGSEGNIQRILDLFLVKDKEKLFKNAYYLLSKQKYFLAIAMFLLAESLNDAIQVAMRYCNHDWQLAFLLLKLYSQKSDNIADISILDTFKSIPCTLISFLQSKNIAEILQPISNALLSPIQESVLDHFILFKLLQIFKTKCTFSFGYKDEILMRNVRMHIHIGNVYYAKQQLDSINTTRLFQLEQTKILLKKAIDSIWTRMMISHGMFGNDKEYIKAFEESLYPCYDGFVDPWNTISYAKGLLNINPDIPYIISLQIKAIEFQKTWFMNQLIEFTNGIVTSIEYNVNSVNDDIVSLLYVFKEKNNDEKLDKWMRMVMEQHVPLLVQYHQICIINTKDHHYHLDINDESYATPPRGSNSSLILGRNEHNDDHILISSFSLLFPLYILHSIAHDHLASLKDQIEKLISNNMDDESILLLMHSWSDTIYADNSNHLVDDAVEMTDEAFLNYILLGQTERDASKERESIKQFYLILHLFVYVYDTFIRNTYIGTLSDIWYRIINSLLIVSRYRELYLQDESIEMLKTRNMNNVNTCAMLGNLFEEEESKSIPCYIPEQSMNACVLKIFDSSKYHSLHYIGMNPVNPSQITCWVTMDTRHHDTRDIQDRIEVLDWDATMLSYEYMNMMIHSKLDTLSLPSIQYPQVTASPFSESDITETQNETVSISRRSASPFSEKEDSSRQQSSINISSLEKDRITPISNNIIQGHKIKTFRVRKQLQDTNAATSSITTMNVHPTLPLYLTGNSNGTIDLWQFHSNNQDNEENGELSMLTFHSSHSHLHSHSKVTKICFIAENIADESGQHFAAGFNDGQVNVWNLNVQKQFLGPSHSFKTHFKHVSDLTFLDSMMDIAVIGTGSSSFGHHGSDEYELGIWDLLVPSANQCVQLYKSSPSKYYSYIPKVILYHSDKKLVITGGSDGDMAVYDTRQQKLLIRTKGHALHDHPKANLDITAMALGRNQTILTASSSGIIKEWDLDSFSCTRSWTLGTKQSIITSDVKSTTELSVPLTDVKDVSSMKSLPIDYSLSSLSDVQKRQKQVSHRSIQQIQIFDESFYLTTLDGCIVKCLYT